VIRGWSARITEKRVNLPPATQHLLVNRVGIAVEAVLLHEHFGNVVTVEIELIDKVSRGIKLFRRQFVGLEIYEGRFEGRRPLLRLSDQQKIAASFRRASSGSIQLFVAPASAFVGVQTKVSSSVRATSFGFDRE